MYHMLTVLTGIVLAVMISVNGNLTAQYGAFPAAAIIHAVGVVAAGVLCALQKDKKKLTGHKPFWIYLGGAVGVATTVFQNLAFGKISMTSIVALGLLGQTAASLLVDSFGLMGMKRHPFPKENIPGLILSLIGILVMFDSSMSISAAVAILISFGAGITVVISRTMNARLGEYTGALRSSLVAHLVGLPITILIALLVTQGNMLQGAATMPFRPWIYLGGVMGVSVILLCNLTVPKVPAYQLTVLTFVGQIFTGIALDLLLGNEYQNVSFWGGLIIASGIAANYYLGHRMKVKKQKEQEYWDNIHKAESAHKEQVYGKRKSQ